MAVVTIFFVTFLNYIGVKKAGEFQLVFTLLKVAVIVVIIVVGFSYASGSWGHFAAGYAGAKGGMTGFMAALVASLWAYDGWNNLTMISGEVRSPEHNLPISLIAGVASG